MVNLLMRKQPAQISQLSIPFLVLLKAEVNYCSS